MAKLLSKYLLATVLLMFIGLYWILATESGAQSALGLARSSLPGLELGAVKGRLIGPLELRGVRYESETMQLDIPEAVLDWRPRNLWQGELLVTKLTANNINLVQLASAEEPVNDEEALVLPTELPLPISVRILDLTVNGLEWRSRADAPPFVITSLHALIAASSSIVDIRSLTVEAPLFSVKGMLRTNVSRNYDTDATLDWQVRVDEVASVTGKLQANGDLDELRSEVNANAQTEDYGDFTAALSGVANRDSANIEQLEVLLDGTDLRIAGEGQMDFSSSDIDATLRWKNLQWPLPAMQQDFQQQDVAAVLIASETGSLNLEGKLEAYAAELIADISTSQTPDGTISAAANGSTQHLNVNALTLNALSGSVTGSANFDWHAGLKSEFDLLGERLNPGELSPQWPGSMSFVVKGYQEAADDSKAQKIAVEQLSVNGSLRDVPIDVKAQLLIDGQTTTVEALNVNAGSSLLQASGVIGEQSDFSWQLKSSNLATLHPKAAGALTSKGKVTGALPWPIVAMTLNGNNVRYDGIALAKISLNAELDLMSDEQSTLRATIVDAEVPGVSIDNLSLELDGNQKQHRAHIASATQYGDADLHLTGALKDEVWHGQLLRGNLTPKESAPWLLESPAKIIAGAEQQSIEQACFRDNAAGVCLQGKAAGQQLSGELTVENLDLALFGNMLSPELTVQGALSGEASFNQTKNNTWQLQSRLANSASTLSVRNDSAQSMTELLSLQPGFIELAGNQKAIDAQITLPFTDGGGINGTIKVSDESADLAHGKLAGNVTLEIPKLDFLAAFSPEIQKIRGALNGEFALQGRVDKPAPEGELRISEAAIDLVTPGLSLQNLTVIATANDSSAFNYSGEAQSDGGSLALSGSTLLGVDNTDTKLTIKGEQFQIWNTADARVWASPDLQIDIHGQATKLTGTVTVPRAELTPKELPQGAIDVSRDQVIITTNESGEEEIDAAQDQLIDARVKLVLGEQVEISGFGFKGRIEGELDVKQQPKKPLLASGELNVKDGEYRAYGQGLVIDQGQFLFAGGEIDNPGLSVRALRRPADDIVVGVNVRGELRQPDISLFSEPGMSSSDQLSWLVLGRPMETASGAESDYIAQAALALGVKGGNFLTKGIGESLGLDSIGIQTGSGEAGAASDVNQAALVIGKYITPKLYVSYGVGLLESISTVKLRYLMTKRWNLVSESSAISSGGDISYSFEK